MDTDGNLGYISRLVTRNNILSRDVIISKLGVVRWQNFQQNLSV